MDVRLGASGNKQLGGFVDGRANTLEPLVLVTLNGEVKLTAQRLFRLFAKVNQLFQATFVVAPALGAAHHFMAALQYGCLLSAIAANQQIQLAIIEFIGLANWPGGNRSSIGIGVVYVFWHDKL